MSQQLQLKFSSISSLNDNTFSRCYFKHLVKTAVKVKSWQLIQMSAQKRQRALTIRGNVSSIIY